MIYTLEYPSDILSMSRILEATAFVPSAQLNSLRDKHWNYHSRFKHQAWEQRSVWMNFGLKSTLGRDRSAKEIEI